MIFFFFFVLPPLPYSNVRPLGFASDLETLPSFDFIFRPRPSSIIVFLRLSSLLTSLPLTLARAGESRSSLSPLVRPPGWLPFVFLFSCVIDSRDYLALAKIASHLLFRFRIRYLLESLLRVLRRRILSVCTFLVFGSLHLPFQKCFACRSLPILLCQSLLKPERELRFTFFSPFFDPWVGSLSDSFHRPLSLYPNSPVAHLALSSVIPQ